MNFAIELFLAIPIIVAFDYLVFGKLMRTCYYTRNEKGEFEPMAKWHWLFPTFIEVSCFIIGYVFGVYRGY